jgi:myo-inositol-1(or 4)-monophosphatase
MELDKIIVEVVQIAKEAGQIIRENIRQISAQDIKLKGQNDFVTCVDKTSENHIIKSLNSLLPDAGFIAEETPDLATAEEYNWIIDPLDGTTNFINGLFPCSVSIALKKDDNIILGVVYEVGFDECFYAIKDKGAFLNGIPIQVSKKTNLHESLLATGFPYNDFSRLNEYIELLKSFATKTQGIRRFGSAATDLAYVACGRFDGFYEYNLKSYDVAAGIILVQEAGGKLCDFKGGNSFLFGKEIIASTPAIFQEFSTEILKFMNK